jgi:hypothetical protein
MNEPTQAGKVTHPKYRTTDQEAAQAGKVTHPKYRTTDQEAAQADEAPGEAEQAEADALVGRHPAVRALHRWLTPNPRLPTGAATDIAQACQMLAKIATTVIGTDDPELTTGLRKLLEAKDAFVRAAIAQQDNAEENR